LFTVLNGPLWGSQSWLRTRFPAGPSRLLRRLAGTIARPRPFSNPLRKRLQHSWKCSNGPRARSCHRINCKPLPRGRGSV